MSSDELEKLQNFQLETPFFMTKIRFKIVKRDKKKTSIAWIVKDKTELDPGEEAEDRCEWDPGE